MSTFANVAEGSLLQSDLRDQQQQYSNTKAFLRCDSQQFGCGMDRVHLCHYTGVQFTTVCVRARSSIVRHLHRDDYCGQCVETGSQTARESFTTTKELRSAVQTYLTSKFYPQDLADKYGWPIGQWDVSQISDFSHLFAKRTAFNEDISQWNMSRATNLDFMFWHAHSFEGEGIEQWDVSRVTSMERTFFAAESFSADISRWNVSNVVNFEKCLAQSSPYFQSTVVQHALLLSWGVDMASSNHANMFSDRIGTLETTKEQQQHTSIYLDVNALQKIAGRRNITNMEEGIGVESQQREGSADDEVISRGIFCHRGLYK